MSPFAIVVMCGFGLLVMFGIGLAIRSVAEDVADDAIAKHKKDAHGN